jgi:pimeloyl-ACP methyl ester carboxylesterase
MRLRIAEAANTHYGWPLHVIEEAGHICFADQPEAVLRALHASIVAL